MNRPEPREGDIVSMLGPAAMWRIERADADGLCRGAAFGARLFGFAPRIERVAGACVCIMGPGQLVNKVLGLGLEGPAEEATLERIEAAFAAVELEPQFEVWPELDPGFEGRLERRGYHVSGTLCVLAMTLGGRMPAPAAAGAVRVERVGPDNADVYELTVSRGFKDMDAGEPDPAERVFARGAARNPETEAWLARVDGVPAGGGALAAVSGLATLYGASTLPAFRRRGVQRALLGARLARAARLGCDLAFMKAAPGSSSERNARRAGLTLSAGKTIWTRAADR